jgi:signal transduction histidine kinase
MRPQSSPSWPTWPALTWRTALLCGPLLLVIFTAVDSFQNFRSHERRVAASNTIFGLLAEVNQIFADLEGAESAKRGYLLTGGSLYMSRYDGLVHNLERDFRAAASHAEALPEGQERLERLQTLCSAKVAEMNKTIARFQSDGLPAALAVMQEDSAGHHMDQIRDELAALIADATKLREAHRDESLAQAKRTNLIVASVCTLMLLLLALATFMIERDQQIQRRYLSRIRSLNQTLEEKVIDRTQALEETNRELEAFCYSVSHDLRAPLRSVDGFAKILARDYVGRPLDQRAKDLMARMSAATVRMGQLIDDLLNLSRIARGGIQPTEFNLSAVAESVVEALRAQEPARQMEVSIEPELHIRGDPRLLQVALENLFGNAWKFTRQQAPARIAFGREAPDGPFFVRDNGVGFDMAYSKQLFVPFQRLHRDSEFEGTGIGLATVERVIHSHGGRIWAESQPGLGATFHFTLETERRSTFDESRVDFTGGGQSGRRVAHA